MNCKFRNGERIVCINNYEMEDCLVLDKVYVVDYDKYRCDQWYVNGFFDDRFINLSEYRKKKLEKLEGI